MCGAADGVAHADRTRAASNAAALAEIAHFEDISFHCAPAPGAPTPPCWTAPRVSGVIDTIRVQERGRVIEFSFDDMMRYHGPGSPAGVANAFKVMQRAYPLLSPDEPPPRRSVVIRTAFGGPGARDGFEAVTRAVTEGHYIIDEELARPDLGRLRQSFVFEVTIGDRGVTLVLRDGFVTEEFVDLAQNDDRTDAQEARLDELKAQLAQRVMAARAEEVYDVAEASRPREPRL